MGCVIVRPSKTHNLDSYSSAGLHANRLSRCHTDSPLEMTQRLAAEQQANQLENSQTASTELSKRPLKIFKAAKVPIKNSESYLKIKLSSNNPSLQDFSFKGSPEASFDKEKEKEIGPLASRVDRPDSHNPAIMKGSTPSFARPSGFRAPTIVIGTQPLDSGPREENYQCSFGPLKESQSHFSPTPQSVASRQSRDRSNSQEKSEKEIDKETEKETKKSVPLTIRTDSEEGVSPGQETKVDSGKSKTTSYVPLKSIHQKFQRLRLAEALGHELGTTPKNEPKTPQKAYSLDAKQQKVRENSPPKTLAMLDNPYSFDDPPKKSLDLPDNTVITASTTNICSIGTISNLISMCKDVKKKDFEKKFRTNLVDLIRENSKENQTETERRDTDKISVRGNKVRRLSHFSTSNQEKLMTKPSFSNNLLSMMKDQDKEQKNERKKSNDDIFSDFDGPSPVNQQEERRMSNKYNLSQIPWLTNLNSSVSKYSENSMMLDKSTRNLEEGVSRIDWDKYSICEQVNNVEIDERSHIEGSFLIDPNDRSNGNTSIIGTDITDCKTPDTQLNLQKTRSAPYQDSVKQDDMESSAPGKSIPTNQLSSKNIPGSESTSTLQFLSPKLITSNSMMVGGGTFKGRRMMKSYSRADSQVVETNRVDVSVDDDGQKKINQFILIKEIGKGGFGKVKLALNADTKTQHAIKIANKKKLKRKLLTRQKSAFTQLASEIAIMKKMALMSFKDHPNIVRLLEVIDDPNNDKLYLIMEFVKRGAVMSKGYWRQASKSKAIDQAQEEESPVVKKKMALSEEKARKYFRHLILGLDYSITESILVSEIIHRDIKPENLLISEDDVLKISDFGISMIMAEGDDTIENNAGTKYYLAPEAWGGTNRKSFHGKPTDIWASGGTLYYFLYGKPPFQGFGADDLQKKIQQEEPNFPEDMKVNPKAIELIKGCLKKDPNQRITLEQIMQDPWLTNDGKEPLQNEECLKLEVTDEELSKALTKVKFMAAVRVMARLKKNLNISRKNIESRKNLDVPSTSSQKKM